MNRALLVGINAYPGGHSLKGCLNDVSDLEQFILSKCGFLKSDIRIVTDAVATTVGILDALNWLVNGLSKGDRVLFQYSGHGAQLPTLDPVGEVDGLDEVICPVDFDWTDKHVIRDKDFARLFGSVPTGVEFVWISDSCHSGDLYRLAAPRYRVKTIPPPENIRSLLEPISGRESFRPLGLRGAAGPNVALVAACKSDEEAADADFNGRPNGALTYWLLKSLGNPGGLQEPLTTVVADAADSLLKSHYNQHPQLEASQAIAQRAFLV